MKSIIKTIIAIIIIGTINACSNSPVEKIIYVPVTDTTCVDSLVYYRELLRRTQDSLEAVKDTTATDLFVAKYKLNRIKYYNDIAAKGNNIKYLRGWINRVLND